jgi:hypothetical protein
MFLATKSAPIHGVRREAPRESLRDENQLRRDRIAMIVILTIVAAAMALALWLASMGTLPDGNGIYDYPLMP